MLPRGTLTYASNIYRSLVLGRRATHRLSKHYTPENLHGACGLASVMLCLALRDYDLAYLVGADGHVWNEFPHKGQRRGLIIDITEAQFGDVPKGVGVNKEPRPYHKPAYFGARGFQRGVEVLEMIRDDGWYEDPGSCCTVAEIRRWRRVLRQIKARGRLVPRA